MFLAIPENWKAHEIRTKTKKGRANLLLGFTTWTRKTHEQYQILSCIIRFGTFGQHEVCDEQKVGTYALPQG